MSPDSAPVTLWTLRDPASDRTVKCVLFDLDEIVYVRLIHSGERAASAEAFDGRVAAIHHAARLAIQFREQGWIDG
jgi:hypothetical protein